MPRAQVPFTWLAVLVLLGSIAHAEDAPPSPAAAQRAASPQAPIPAVTSGLARAAVRAALRAGGFPERWALLGSLSARAKSAALLPDLSLRVARSTDQSLRLSPTLDDPARYSEAGGAGVTLEARATWHLDRLLFDGQELAVERLRSERAEAAGKLCGRVLDLLFTWQRAVARDEDPGLSDDERREALLRRIEAEVRLDVLTQGWFSGATGPARAR